jgi:hypothetical protein
MAAPEAPDFAYFFLHIRGPPGEAAEQQQLKVDLKAVNLVQRGPQGPPHPRKRAPLDQNTIASLANPNLWRSP